MSIEHENLDIAQHQDESGLEQYGVWVKKTPEEELAEEVRDHQDNANSSDIFLDDIDFENLPHADISDSAVEEAVIDSQLNDKIEEALDAEEKTAYAQIDEEAESVSETAGLEDFAADLEDFQLPEAEQEIAPAVPSVEEALAAKDMETFTDTAMVDIELDEYMVDSENPEDSLLDEKPLDINLSFEDNFETITPDFPKEETPSEIAFEAEDVSDIFTDNADGEIKTEEVSLEEFEQSDEAVPEKDEIPDITEIPEMADLGEMEEFAENGTYEFPVDFSTRSDAAEEKAEEPLQNAEPDNSGGAVMENIDISEFNSDVSSHEEADPKKTAENSSETVYNIAVRADDDPEIEEEKERENIAAAENPAIQAMSSALFEKIMGELSLLRRDITDLKTDLTSLKSADSAYEAPLEGKGSSKAGGGFFAEDEEDETIALSGDELNNILTSADFTSSEPSAPSEEIAEETGDFENTLTTEENPAEETEAPVLNLQETELTEPELDDINFDITDEEEQKELPNEITLPVNEDLIVDSANDDFFAEEDTPKALDDTAMHFLCEDPAECESLEEAETAEPREREENENIEVLEEQSEDVFKDTDIAADAEDIFGHTQTEETESAESVEAIEPEITDADPVPENPESQDETADVFAVEEDSLEPAEDDITEEESETEIPSAFDMDFEEENTPEDLSQFSPVGEVFNSKQWLGEEEAAAEEEIPNEKDDDIIIEADPEEEPKSETSAETKVSADFIPSAEIPQNMREEIKSVLAYMDQLLENLPEEKIVEFARSEHFPVYKKLFTELGLS